MRIGNSTGLDIFVLAQARNNQHQLSSSKMPNKSNGNGQQSQIQRQRCLAEYMDFMPSDQLFGLAARRIGVNDHPQALILTEAHKELLQLRTCSISYANAAVKLLIFLR